MGNRKKQFVISILIFLFSIQFVKAEQNMHTFSNFKELRKLKELNTTTDFKDGAVVSAATNWENKRIYKIETEYSLYPFEYEKTYDENGHLMFARSYFRGTLVESYEYDLNKKKWNTVNYWNLRGLMSVESFTKLMHDKAQINILKKDNFASVDFGFDKNAQKYYLVFYNDDSDKQGKPNIAYVVAGDTGEIVFMSPWVGTPFFLGDSMPIPENIFHKYLKSLGKEIDPPDLERAIEREDLLVREKLYIEKGEFPKPSEGLMKFVTSSHGGIVHE